MGINAYLDEFHEQHKKYSNAYMAEKLEISEQRYGQYRKGTRNPKLDFYLKFKNAFGIDLLLLTNNSDDLMKELKAINKRLANIEKLLKQNS